MAYKPTLILIPSYKTLLSILQYLGTTYIAYNIGVLGRSKLAIYRCIGNTREIGLILTTSIIILTLFGTISPILRDI